jgi:hypothetical protein
MLAVLSSGHAAIRPNAHLVEGVPALGLTYSLRPQNNYKPIRGGLLASGGSHRLMAHVQTERTVNIGGRHRSSGAERRDTLYSLNAPIRSPHPTTADTVGSAAPTCFST